MRVINIYDAKTHFSKLINAVLQGEEVIIAKAGKSVAKLVPMMAKKPKRKFGVLKGKIKIAGDFDACLPDGLLKSFKGGGSG